MNQTSQLMPMNQTECPSSGYHSPVLLSESAISRLYRVSKAGKHFIIKTAKDDSARLQSLIRREYEISIDLSHPHLINVFTFEEDTPVGPGIVMEYVDGRNLMDFLKEQPSMQLRRRVLDQLLDAVGYLHRKGIVHNDLKPENILISRVDNDVKLIDFGLSDNDAWYLSNTQGCTPEYASPELLRQDSPDSRSDIYSLGLLIRDMFGIKVSRIVRKCTEAERKDRYSNVEQIRKAFARRHRPVYIAATAICLVALIMSAVGMKERLDDFRHFQAEERQKRDLCDSVYNAIDTYINNMYSELETKLQEIPYQEFAFLEMGKTMARLPELWDSFSRATSDQTLISGFISHCTLIQNQHYDRITKMIDEIPSLTKFGLSYEEQQFYYALVGQNESYRPFEK